MKTIRQILLSLVIITTATGPCFSQTYSITPADTFTLTGYLEDLQTLTISQTNTSNDTIHLKWQKVSETIPPNWEASICDNRVCYTTLMDSGEMNPVLTNESGYLILHITGHVNYGRAIIRYAVWDRANFAIKDTVTFILDISQVSAINDVQNKPIFQIFPNPVNDLLNLSTADNVLYTLNVYNTLGEKTCSTVFTSPFQLSTASWLPGNYLLKINSADKLITKKISKQ